MQDARDPLAVEILTGERCDTPMAEVVEAGQDAAVPAGEDRLAPGFDDGVVVFGALNFPSERAAQAADEGGGGKGDGRGL